MVSVALQAQQTLQQAWDLAAKGQGQAAIRLLNELVVREPMNADVRLLAREVSLMEAGDHDGSIEQLRDGPQAGGPKSAEALNALGEAYSKFGESAEAREAFQNAVLLDPKFGVSQLNLGQALLAAGEGGKAEGHLDRAIELLGRSDDAATGYYLRAKVYSAAGGAEQGCGATCERRKWRFVRILRRRGRIWDRRGERFWTVLEPWRRLRLRCG